MSLKKVPLVLLLISTFAGCTVFADAIDAALHTYKKAYDRLVIELPKIKFCARQNDAFSQVGLSQCHTSYSIRSGDPHQTGKTLSDYFNAQRALIGKRLLIDGINTISLGMFLGAIYSLSLSKERRKQFKKNKYTGPLCAIGLFLATLILLKNNDKYNDLPGITYDLHKTPLFSPARNVWHAILSVGMGLCGAIATDLVCDRLGTLVQKEAQTGVA